MIASALPGFLKIHHSPLSAGWVVVLVIIGSVIVLIFLWATAGQGRRSRLRVRPPVSEDDSEDDSDDDSDDHPSDGRPGGPAP